MARSVIIFGCGNVIMGDDGFGPGVVEQLKDSCTLPENVEAVDAGTGVREYLFDFLLTEEGRPGMVIILDAVDFPDRDPGEVFRLSPADIPAQKIHDFSLHQFPTVNLLLELEQHTGVRVIILAAQIEFIPEEIAPGLSPAMYAAIDKACAEIFHILSEEWT